MSKVSSGLEREMAHDNALWGLVEEIVSHVKADTSTFIRIKTHI